MLRAAGHPECSGVLRFTASEFGGAQQLKGVIARPGVVGGHRQSASDDVMQPVITGCRLHKE